MLKKVYSVEFMQYTNYTKTAVSTGSSIHSDLKYLGVGYEPFLVTEDNLEKYKCFGNGYKSIIFVGNMEFDN